MSRSTADITKHLAKLKAAETKTVEQLGSDTADKSKIQIDNTTSSSSMSEVESNFSNSLTLTTGESKVEDQGEACSYTKLNDHFDKSKGRIIIDQYVAMVIPRNPNFFMLTYVGERKDECEEGKISTIVGLKFHISLPEPDNEKFELSRGWGIINSVLRAHQADMKMIRRGINMFDVPEQRGKIITVYTSPEKDNKAWQSMFQ